MVRRRQRERSLLEVLFAEALLLSHADDPYNIAGLLAVLFETGRRSGKPRSSFSACRATRARLLPGCRQVRRPAESWAVCGRHATSVPATGPDVNSI